MSHLIQTMAYMGVTPWHGIGNRLTAHQPTEVWAEQSGINFSIQETDVQYVTDRDQGLDAIKSFPEQKVLYRSDNLQPLSVVSQRFKVVQPREILEFYRDLTEVSGFELETAGVLKGGRKIWALARTGQSATLKGKDVMQGYLLLATACDGTLATTAQFTSIRVVCNNTLAIALNDGRDAVKVPHSTSFDAQAVKQQLGVTVSTWDTFMYRMKQLAERKVTDQEAETFYRQVMGSSDEATSHYERVMSRMMALFEGQGLGAELSSSKGTAFGLLNSVTQYVDHERRARTPEHRLDAAWFGQGAGLKQRALDQALCVTL